MATRVFRYPFDIQSTLEPWRGDLHSLDQVAAHMADRDRALEDFLGQVSRDTAGDYFINPRLGVGETSFFPGGVETLETGGAFSGLSMVDQNDATKRWVVYPNSSKLRFFDGTADRVTFDRTSGLVTVQPGSTGSAIIGVSPGFGAPWAQFSNAAQTGTGYALLQSDAGQTLLNCASGQDIEFRGNNTQLMRMQSSGRFSGTFNGFGNTFAQVSDGATMLVNTGSGGNPNYVIQCGTIVISMSGGNGNFNWPVAFQQGVAGVVACEAGGFSDTVVGVQNASLTGTGIYAIHAGGTVTGLLRFNYIVVGF